MSDYDDYQASEDQLDSQDTLLNDDVSDPLDVGYAPPEYPPRKYGEETDEHESLDERLSEEEDDPVSHIGQIDLTTGRPYDDSDTGDEADDTQVGGPRSGRLVAPDNGLLGHDHEEEAIADDVGIDGGAATAEEAAMHIIEDPQS